MCLGCEKKVGPNHHCMFKSLAILIECEDRSDDDDILIKSGILVKNDVSLDKRGEVEPN